MLRVWREQKHGRHITYNTICCRIKGPDTSITMKMMVSTAWKRISLQ